jgi:CoA:oxalate CoA-transferase
VTDATTTLGAAPLAGLRVFDMTRVLAGPFATALLADLGAEVIKLEPPKGDDYRHIGPFREGESALFLLINRGKRSIALDLKAPEGRAIALEIAAKCDVVVENFRPGVAERLGLGPEDIRARRPDIVYARISGFGQDSPWAGRAAYDLVVQAMSGLMAATGEEGGAPLRTGESIGDLAAGLYASWAILAALFQRQRTGQGAVIDVAMFDTLYSLLPTSHAQHFYGGEIPRRVGNRHPLSTPFGGFRTSDGHAVIAVLTEGQFARFAALIGQAGLETDPRFASDSARTVNEAALRQMIEAWTGARTTDEAVAALSAAGIPAAPILDIAEAGETEHARARGLVRSLPHARLGAHPVVAQPVRFDGIAHAAATAAPLLGADSEAVLANLAGLEEDEIVRLRKVGVVAGEHADD